MSLYAISDLHLHFQSELKAPGQLHDRVWKNHEEKFRKNCGMLLRQEDTLVLVGDHSWGKNLKECEPDLEYICDWSSDVCSSDLAECRAGRGTRARVRMGAD